MLQPSMPVRGRLGAADFVEWDVLNWSTALAVWSSASARLAPGCSVLEVGSRHGGLSMWFAQLGARVVCSDLRRPTDQAITVHRAAGLADRISYAVLDATRIPFRDQFDIIAFKSVLGALEPRCQREAIRRMYAALKPGGELLFAENLVASPLHAFCRRHFVAWGSTWHYVSVARMREYLKPFGFLRYRTFGFAGAFGRRGRSLPALAMVDRMGLSHVVPESWRYIMAGVARKEAPPPGSVSGHYPAGPAASTGM